MTASTSKAKDDLTIQVRSSSLDDVNKLENGGQRLSPNASIRTDDDACSEIIRIENSDKKVEEHNESAIRRLVRTLQVRGKVSQNLFRIAKSTYI